MNMCTLLRLDDQLRTPVAPSIALSPQDTEELLAVFGFKSVAGSTLLPVHEASCLAQVQQACRTGSTALHALLLDLRTASHILVEI